MANISQGIVASTVSGDPTIALIAQVNRFRRSAGQPERQLVAMPITADLANEVINIERARVSKAYTVVKDPQVLLMIKALDAAMANPVAYVAPRATSLTQSIALYGDALGLPPASVGITTVSTAFGWSGLRWAMTLAFVGIASFLGFRAYQKRRAVTGA